ncbi:hypothetical protein F383_11628 [Gossypium arboreum]|uniref:Uncharacterized protein n=2 Tax=Gossypium arboreum TaxID=29729 RepID=A0ABR0N269_GOSAR|nr:uncharacterized protein LOC108472418 [Gossypium arboreum]XP_017629421.1 uncharacterized protein LOC108472418 [Gossypium arboreum]XP_052877054.1 uncharacterized protein LOC108472418 [Gossypium arboreum]XP_052877055.1 uncharacterized protein LOC108472418 [Gossypium arboreum]KAK5783749.1 hypothetical protein PVK06_038262 [Gossypium arboreum]KHG29183.1 hypothetical protein F383_11628 [Gossypium arboreum]
MDHSYLKETSIEVDLESGGTISEDERTKGHGSSNLQTNKNFSRVWSNLLRFDSVGKGKYGVNSCSSSSRFGSVEGENMEFWVDKSSEGEDNHDLMALVEKNFAEDNCKKKNSRKPPKPPRPPKAPLLDAADQQLVREIAELSMRKRARIKRIKAMKKMKAANAAPSSSSSLFAMVITVILCLVILFQGICYRRGTTVMLQGSPAPAVGEGLISVQFYKTFPTTEKHDHDPPSLLEQQGSSSVLGGETRKVD